MEVSVLSPNLFIFDAEGGINPQKDIPRVVTFAYQVAERVGQRVYIAAFAVDGRTVGGPVQEGPRDGAVVRRGREDAIRVKSWGGGRDIVLWCPPSREWSCELIGHHWWRQRQISWGVLVDGRDVDGVVSNLQTTWPRRSREIGDPLRLLDSTVGRERKLAMVSYDGTFFSGKASTDCWEIVLGLLRGISGDKLQVYQDDQANHG